MKSIAATEFISKYELWIGGHRAKPDAYIKCATALLRGFNGKIKPLLDEKIPLAARVKKAYLVSILTFLNETDLSDITIQCDLEERVIGNFDIVDAYFIDSDPEKRLYTNYFTPLNKLIRMRRSTDSFIEYLGESLPTYKTTVFRFLQWYKKVASEDNRKKMQSYLTEEQIDALIAFTYPKVKVEAFSIIPFREQFLNNAPKLIDKIVLSMVIYDNMPVTSIIKLTEYDLSTQTFSDTTQKLITTFFNGAKGKAKVYPFPENVNKSYIERLFASTAKSIGLVNLKIPDIRKILTENEKS